MRTYIMIWASINAFLGSRAFALRQYARGCGYVLTAPAIGGGGCAHTPPRGGLLRNAQYAPSCAATRLRSIRRACSGYVLTAPRLGAVARIRLRTSMTTPVLRQICHPNSRFSELFATISPALCATIAHSAPYSRRRHGTLYRSKQLGV